MTVEIIPLHYPIKEDLQAPKQVLAMGFFDGVHHGHQAVIEQARLAAEKRGEELAVLTYYPYPAAVFEKMDYPIRYLTPIKQKSALMEKMGVRRLYVLQLTSALAALSAQSFVDQVLMKLHPSEVVAGFDHQYGGPDEAADMDHLAVYARGRFATLTVPALEEQGEKFSSTRVRQALGAGDLKTVREQLGRFHRTTGLIVHGDARGRTLGFPTVNVLTPEQQWLPAIGVYAVRVKIAGQWHIGMASIGRNVTFGANRPITVEINILDFNQAVYGENIEVEWCQHLRGEVRFDGASALIEQLKADRQATRNYFKSI
ncbi:riboflavin biosynthesis protein RibF [Eupransor demetentiae]|uniref:Riboflavin biosynthesis protein n=1 Tax=Eupransor demetentiae TaxID=3109584 RepID=A0ABM9N4E8_9LACO|nr:FAD synthase (RibF) [Lactobacillaceae bacterium LMG 33000]